MTESKHRYQEPKQPPFIRKAHRYRFRVYGLDSVLELPATSRKKDLMQATTGHILQSEKTPAGISLEKN